MQGFQANIFSAKRLELTRLGTYSNAIGDSHERDWGLTRTRLGTYWKGEPSLFFKRGLVEAQARARCFSNEGSVVKTNQMIVSRNSQREVARIEETILFIPPSILQKDSIGMDFCSYFKW